MHLVYSFVTQHSSGFNSVRPQENSDHILSSFSFALSVPLASVMAIIPQLLLIVCWPFGTSCQAEHTQEHISLSGACVYPLPLEGACTLCNTDTTAVLISDTGASTKYLPVPGNNSLSSPACYPSRIVGNLYAPSSMRESRLVAELRSSRQHREHGRFQ